MDALISPSPRPDLPGAEVFAPLIASWDLVVTDVADDGTSSDRTGEWHFAWALDGRAVVDVWISPSRAVRAEDGDAGEWGMTVRFPDPVTGRWRSTWHGPARGWLIPFEAAVDSGAPVLTSELDGVTRRWIFSDVTPASFAGLPRRASTVRRSASASGSSRPDPPGRILVRSVTDRMTSVVGRPATWFPATELITAGRTGLCDNSGTWSPQV